MELGYYPPRVTSLAHFKTSSNSFEIPFEGSLGCIMSASGIDYSDAILELEWEIKKVMEKENICGLSIALVEGDQLVWAEGFGYTDRTKKEKLLKHCSASNQ